MYKKFKTLMDDRGVKAAQVSRETGIDQATFSHWKKGLYEPKMSTIQKIADYFDVPLSYFYGEGEPQVRKVPVYEVAAGPGRVNEDYPAETIEEVLDDEHSFLIVRGDSMLPVLHDGDLIKVHHQSETSPSDFTVVKINGNEATVKHVEITSDGVWLRAENKAEYQDKFYTIQEVMTLPVLIIGKAVEFKRKL